MEHTLRNIGRVAATRSRRAALAGTFLLALTAAAPAGATALGATWGAGCGSSTCFDAHGAYALTFSASAFSGPVDIGSLLLDRRVLGSMGGNFFNVSFQLGGHQVGSWGNWNMGGVAGDELTLSGPDLTWNPTDGDLVLVLQLVAPNGAVLGSDQGAGGFFGGDPWAPVGTGDGGAGSGVVVDLLSLPFEPLGDPPSGGTPPPSIDGPGIQSPPSSSVGGGVPEPSSWALMIGGVAMAGAALRRRKSGAPARAA